MLETEMNEACEKDAANASNEGVGNTNSKFIMKRGFEAAKTKQRKQKPKRNKKRNKTNQTKSKLWPTQ